MGVMNAVTIDLWKWWHFILDKKKTCTHNACVVCLKIKSRMAKRRRLDWPFQNAEELRRTRINQINQCRISMENWDESPGHIDTALRIICPMVSERDSASMPWTIVARRFAPARFSGSLSQRVWNEDERHFTKSVFYETTKSFQNA